MRAGTTIDPAKLRELADHRGDPVTSSVYLDVDGSHRPVPASYEEAFERMAGELRLRARSQDDPRVAESVEADLGRMRAFLGRGVDRSSTRGLGFFASSLQGYFEAVELPVAVRDEASLGPAPRVRQLVERLEEPEPTLVALVDRHRLRRFLLAGHRLDELPPLTAPDDRVIDTSIELGSWEHHREEASRQHLRRAAAAVDEAARRQQVRQLVLGGPDEALAGLEDFLRPETRRLAIGRAQVRVTAEAHEIAEAARQVAEEEERRREAELVEELRQRTAGDHGAAVGLEASLGALDARHVATLVVRDGFSAPGGWCPACGHVGIDVRRCQVCGALNMEVDDVVELAIEEAIAQGAAVEFCRDAELDRYGSIGTIARY